MPSPGAPRAGQRRRRPGVGVGNGSGGQQQQPPSSSPGACSPVSIGASLSGTRALESPAGGPTARTAAASSQGHGHGRGSNSRSPVVGGASAGYKGSAAGTGAAAGAETRDDNAAAAEAAAEEAAAAQAGSGSCGIGGLPSLLVGDNLVISVVSGGFSGSSNGGGAGAGSGGSRTYASASSGANKTTAAQDTTNGTSPSAAKGASTDAGSPSRSNGAVAYGIGKSSARQTATSATSAKTNGGKNNNGGTQHRANGASSSGTSIDQGHQPRAQHSSEVQEEAQEEEEEGLFDWVGSSIQSAYDAMFSPTGEDAGANADTNASNAAASSSSSTAQTHARDESSLGGGSGALQADSSSGQAVISSKKGNYLKSGGKSPVSFASHTHTATTATTTADGTPADDSSPVRASKTNRGYRRAQTAPPTSTTTSASTSSPDHADPSTRGAQSRRNSGGGGGGGGTLQTAASMDSIDSRGRRRKIPSKLLNRSSNTIRESLAGGAAAGKSRVAASLKMSRSRSDNHGTDERGGSGGVAERTPSPSKAASPDAAATCSRDEQDSGSGLRLSSLRPPLGPRLGNNRSGKKDGSGGTVSWAEMHDKLIDELFEASRRQYIATHFGGEGGQNGHHHLHEQPKEKEQKEHSGWKLGNLLSGSGGGNDTDVDGAKSKKKKGDQISADTGTKDGTFRLPWSSHTATKKKQRKRKRPKLFRRKKKEAASTSMVGAIGASMTSALAATAAVVTGGATSAKEESATSAPTKDKQGKIQSGPSTESNSSSPFLPRIGRFSPSKKKLSDSTLTDVHRSVTFAKGTAGPKRSLVRATGEYTGRQNPDPGTYLHPKCRLQKDKGRGDVPGNAICAVSREKALDKLRQKVDVIIEVEQSSTASTKAKLKLKQAVLNATAGEDDGMIETRSVIGVKMGFLSMKYGILLRWDSETGLVNLIVLRKMCPSGFLTGDDGNAAITTDAGTPTKASTGNGASATAIPSPAVPPLSGEVKESPIKRSRRSMKESSPSKHGLILGRLVDGANAILHGKGWDSDASAVGTEVAHLGPPYLVQRPESFADATLSVTVLRAEDLCAGDSRGSDWVVNPYVRLSIGAQTHRTRALKMTTSPKWNNTKLGDNTCRLAVSNNPRDDDQHLKVEVYDWRPLCRDRILGVVFVPVASVEPQKSSRGGAEPVSTEVTIPVRMMRNKEGPYAYVTLSLVHQNDHLCWLKEELRARGK